MIRAVAFAVVLLAVWLGAPSSALAETRLYVVAIGNNGPPSYTTTGERLPTLRFADDDAAAMFALLSPMSHEAELLTVLDATSQAKFPNLASRAHQPSLAELRRLVARWKTQFESDRRAGHEPVLVFFFSGHGSRDGDHKSALVMSDGPLSQDVLYDEILAALPARYVHLLVDACYAESVVRPRDAQAAAVDLGVRDLESIAAKATLARFPHVGAVVAASTTERTFEWDVLERGVFTHGLLSGLRGGADVNGDGRIEYSEIDAFLSAANRSVTDPRARLSVVVKPPAVNRRTPLVELSSTKKHATLLGAPRGGRFYLEDVLGNRVLDAHVEPGFRSTIALPAGKFFLRVDPDGEATLDLVPGARIELASLALSTATSRSRSSIESAMQTGLFATPFGPSYYRAFVDGRDELQAIPLGDGQREPATTSTPVGPDVAPSGTRRAGWITLGGAGAVGIATGIFGGLMLDAKSDYDRTSLERQADEARDRFGTYRTLTIAGAIVTTAVLATSIWLLVREPSGTSSRRVAGAVVLRPDGTFEW